MNHKHRLPLFLVAFCTVVLSFSTSFAAIKSYRWEAGQKPTVSEDLNAILASLNAESGLALSASDFVLVEARALANSQFKNYLQVTAGVPIKGAMIRTWFNPAAQTLIQMEAHLDDGGLSGARQAVLNVHNLKSNLRAKLDALDNMVYIKQIVSRHRDDRRIGQVESKDLWNGTELVREIKVTGRHGVHTILVSHLTRKVISAGYEQHPQLDLEALVYPIYEEADKSKTRQDRVPATLKHIMDTRKDVNGDAYAPLRTRRYFEDMINPVLGETPEGREAGYWSPSWLLREAKNLVSALPDEANTFQNGGVFLEGLYASINIHPDAIAKYQGLSFSPTHSSRLNIAWLQSVDTGLPRWEVVPRGAFYGRPLLSLSEAYERVARRLPDHDVVSYLNDGFDEIQVYYAINTLMESLHNQGFSDPELSTRPFHAFLYDPDISMKNNAYYTNDTINFTTYSPEAQNYARDNSTIWHELGHGVMDRLMGDLLVLNDSGGLSEGMADFVAQLVIQDVTGGKAFDGSKDFRIINNTGFNLTNESHDDGEAYGGAMNDLLMLAIEKYGRDGLHKVADLTLEAMRLTRNHPGLTANDWFEHMLFADRLGRAGLRAPNELQALIVKAIETRNFRLDRGPIAEFQVKVAGEVLTDKNPGSRYNPISHDLAEGSEASHQLEFRLVASEHYKFQFPVKLSIGFNGGPLQGAVKWKDEAQGAKEFVFNSAEEVVTANIGAVAGCDAVNREDGSCSDFAYLQVFNAGAEKAFAKKRFYLRIAKPAAGPGVLVKTRNAK